MQFIVVGENIHCTRVYKTDGKHVQSDGQGFAISYNAGGQTRKMPVPPIFTESADWQAGKLKHCAAAVWQGFYGNAADKVAGIDYLHTLARKQESAGATFLDINVDEFSTDLEERIRLMDWLVNTIQAGVKLPLSIDSSNSAILRAGLRACDPARGRPMVNSVSLERPEAIAIASDFNAVVIASAAGEKELPATTAQRLENMTLLMQRLAAANLTGPAVYLDPLVFPIATDSVNGADFLNAVREARAMFGPEVHITGGLSNVSFGMPARRLINQVFARLTTEAGGDSGIVDPLQINAAIISTLDPAAEPFKLARALLTGEDAFGADYISAHREGRLGGE